MLKYTFTPHNTTYHHDFTQPTPSGVNTDCNKFIQDDGSIALRNYTASSTTTLVCSADLSVRQLSETGEFGYLFSARGGKLIYGNAYSDGVPDGVHLDMYDSETHRRLPSLTSPGDRWGWPTCCVSADGRVVVSDHQNKQIHVYDGEGKCEAGITGIELVG